MGLNRRTWAIRAVAWAISCAGIRAGAASPPGLLLAGVYRPGMTLDGYWVSEKYDGVRGFWDGTTLRTRGGETVVVPPWFTAGWPAVAMDGELWAGRGQFEQASATVRRQSPDDAAWRALRFMVFDLPAHPGTFDERLPALNDVVERIGQPWVIAVVQDRATTHAALQARMRKVVREGAEGLMLHRGASLYRAVRSDDLLKVKPHDDADARVMGYAPGRGRLIGSVGAIEVETPDGLRFRIGSGLSDETRLNPPAIGSWITYRYRGTHASGVPRFASYLRPRHDIAPSSRP